LIKGHGAWIKEKQTTHTPKKTSPVKLLKMFFLKIQTFPIPWLNNHTPVLTIPPCSDENVHNESKHLRGDPGDQRGEVKGQEGLGAALVTKLTVLGSQFPNKDHKIRIHP